MRRRHLLKTVAVGATAALTGCTALASPDPTVVDTEVDDGFGALFGGTDVFVTVQNDGAAGDVEVTLEILDDTGTVLYDESQVVALDADERKRVTFTVDTIPDGADELAAEATLA